MSLSVNIPPSCKTESQVKPANPRMHQQYESQIREKDLES